MKTVKKLLACLFCAALLCSMFPLTALAKTGLNGWPEGSPEPPRISGYQWAVLGAAKSAHVEGNYFVIDTSATVASGLTYAEQLYISLPAEGGFRLQSKHEYQSEVEKSNAGLFEPKALGSMTVKTDSAGAKVLVGSDGTVVKYTATADGFKLQICDTKEKNIISLTNRQISFAYKNGKIVRLMVEMPLTGDGKEAIYGGGERFNSANQVGQYNSLTNVGAANWKSFSYINVPLYHSNRGYSIWFNMVYPGESDIGVNDPKKYSITFDGDKLDFYLWAGTPAQNLKKYTAITGTSGVHEDWVYSFWAGACDTAWNEPNPIANLHELVEGYLEHYGFYPRSLGGEWSVGVSATSMQYQKQRGIRSLGWFMPSQDLLSSSLVKNDLIGLSALPTFDSSGNVLSTGYPYPYVKSLYDKGIYQILDTRWYDGSNPSFKQVIKNRWTPLWDYGSVGAMLDYGEKYDFYGVSYNGLSNMEMHNLNAYYIAKTQYEAWTERLGNNHVLYMRAGTAGSQKYVGNFLGDQEATYKAFMTMVYAMISLGASGFNNYGGDMFSNGGDKYATLTQDLRNRYVSLGTFSPYMRQHGNHLIMPWKQGATLSQNFGSYYYLRENIVPTIMSAAIDANKTSNPMVKGMMFAYPYQLSLGSINNQYLFCDDFLVCAVPDEGTFSLDVSLPAAETWYSLYTYDKYTGGKTVSVDAPTSFMPVFVKSGAVKAINLPDSQVLGTEMHPAEEINKIADYNETETPHASLLITPPNKERTNTIYVKDGASTDYQTYRSHTETYVSKPVDGATFTVTNSKGSDRETVLALGVTAATVSYDGKTLDRLDHIPDYASDEYGYYVELSGLTTIYLPAGWKQIEIVKGAAEYQAYAFEKGGNVIQRMLDGNPKTATTLSNSNQSVELTLDADKPQHIGRIVVKWGAGYYGTYDIEYSADGESWETLLGDGITSDLDYGEHWWSMETAQADSANTVENGAGCFDIINTDITAQYVRLIPVKKGDVAAAPSISAFEAYPYAGLTVIEPVEPGDEDWEDGWDDTDDDPQDDADDADEKTNGKNKKKLITTISYFPTWLIILIVGGGVVVITGTVLLLLMLRKKKKAAAALAAASPDDVSDPPPDDFPGTPDA